MSKTRRQKKREWLNKKAVDGSKRDKLKEDLYKMKKHKALFVRKRTIAEERNAWKQVKELRNKQ